MVENDKYEKLVNELKKLKRYDLMWEWMEEYESGEYVKYDDILKIIELNK